MSKVILYYAWQDRRIKRDEVADHIEAFVSALREMFGEGSAVIERLIMERLNSKVKLVQVVDGDWSLLDYVKLCRQVEETKKR